MKLREAVEKVNEGSGLEFIKGREKGEFEDLIGRELTLEDVAIVQSKYYENESVLFTVAGDAAHYYRVTSGPVAAKIRTLQEGLDEDDLDWDALAVTFVRVRSKQGKRYYDVRARLVDESLAPTADEVPLF